MRRTWLGLLPAIALSFAGAGVSYMLMAKHLAGKTGAAWFDSVCDGGADSAVSCDEVLASQYGLFPPVPPDVEPEQKYQPRPVIGAFAMRPRPVALFGLMYFMALGGWYFFIGRPSYTRRWLHLLPLVLTLCGAVGSACFAYIMFFTELEAWCPWCLVIHGINALLLVCTFLLWPRKPAVEAERADIVQQPAMGSQQVVLDDNGAEPAFEETSVLVAGEPQAPPVPAVAAMASTAPPVAKPAPHPSFRLVLATLAVVVAAMAAEWFFHDYVVAQAQYAALDRAMEAVRNHASTLYTMYLGSDKHEIPIREDDPIRNDGSPRASLVVFSDFECSHCARFERFLSKQVMPLFDPFLKVTFKHFPANKLCNKRVTKNIHPNACRAASAAEAAHALGGNDAFWKAHDLLFASGRKLAQFDYRDLAEQLSLDPDQFLETMDSDAVQDRIQEDIQLGLEIGVNATPAPFLSGRRIPRLATQAPLFWQAAKAKLDARLRQIEARRAQAQKQAQTQPAAQP